ncbi:O-acetylhomoserine aminocarboxypropyltransferase/cysteine synthase family protein [Microbacterium sp. Marseille-Q6965]|uniref:O-acetylhomoserine aminocarboxypropyltransferase/cysteine synthase family protein n=1 Tax=Microbacterium sp. Marseille-Q6965 TaxID=2965072 RepID=UPI0021B78680|nr:aminotransferase class V-fold PLP-dependent enzyme [Microbacterium sp. Marseille-Q6965]
MTDALPEGFVTAQLGAGYEPGAVAQQTVAVPIHQSSAYQFHSLRQARERFALREKGFIYSRNSHPTQAVLEQRVAALEDGVAAAATGSGQAATAVATLALAGHGGHIVAASQLYGGTVDLFHDTLADFGIDVTFVDQDDLNAWHDAVRPQTRAFFAESVANPVAQVLDMAAVAEIAHAAGVPLVIDNTVATPALLRPKRFGADIVVHSATKFLGGHGTSLAGVVVDLGTFDFGAQPERWPALTEPHWRFGGVPLWEAFGREGAFTTLVKSKYIADLGPALSPFNAFQIIEGIETLNLRVDRHAASGLAVARFLSRHPAVAAVHHPGLDSSPWHPLADRYLPRGVPSVFAFELESMGDDEADYARAEAVIDALRVIRLVANIGDARSLACHPATMTHNHLTRDQLSAAGISYATVRLSVGLEDPSELIADLAQALDRL